MQQRELQPLTRNLLARLVELMFNKQEVENNTAGVSIALMLSSAALPISDDTAAWLQHLGPRAKPALVTLFAQGKEAFLHKLDESSQNSADAEQLCLDVCLYCIESLRAGRPAHQLLTDNGTPLASYWSCVDCLQAASTRQLVSGELGRHPALQGLQFDLQRHTQLVASYQPQSADIQSILVCDELCESAGWQALVTSVSSSSYKTLIQARAMLSRRKAQAQTDKQNCDRNESIKRSSGNNTQPAEALAREEKYRKCLTCQKCFESRNKLFRHFAEIPNSDELVCTTPMAK